MTRRTIRNCAIAMIFFAVLGGIFIMIQESDDRTGGFVMGIIVTLISIIFATTAARLERKVTS